MNSKTKGMVAAGLATLLLLAGGYYVHTASFMHKVATVAAKTIGEALAVPVEIGAVEVKSLHTLTVRDIAIYDKQAECIAAAEAVEVEFSLFPMLNGDPVQGIKNVSVYKPELTLKEREDKSWNAEDLLESGGAEPVKFRAAVQVTDGTAHIVLPQKTLTVDNINGTADFAAYPVADISVTADNLGAKIKVDGTVGGEKQFLRLGVTNVTAENYLPLLPPGLLPEGIAIVGAKVDELSLQAREQYGQINLSGEALYRDGQIKVMDTTVEDINGNVFFTEKNLILAAAATANGQTAQAKGTVRWDTPSPYMDLKVTSDSFAPAAVIPTIPVEGAFAFTAAVRGSLAEPVVVGDFTGASGSAEGIYWQDFSCHAELENKMLTVSKLKVSVWDGTVDGEGILNMEDLSYYAHFKPQELNIARAQDFLPQLSAVSGRFGGDIAADGRGDDWSALRVYGSLLARDVSYQNIPVETLSASFATQGQDVTVDYLSAKLPNKSNLGLEGKLTGGRNLAFNFYGAHVDLSLASRIVPEADMTGWGDFRGEVAGDIDNPQLEIKFSGLKGTLFKQPFDSLKTMASGSLDGLTVQNFFMEKDGREVWQVKGSVGLTGERKLDLTVDTIGARMEDIAALVAPDQPITGNIDNIIRLTGTLDAPQGVGYIHMSRGSYRGMLLSGMDGDYTIDGDTVSLQDFHIFSPLIDMDLNGTINALTRALDMRVAVHDIDAKRFEHKLPYEVTGHGTFDGVIGGRTDNPSFSGLLKIPEMTVNGYAVTDFNGEVDYADGKATLKDLSFKQDVGRYDMNLQLDTTAETVSGRMELNQASVDFLLAAANAKTDLVEGLLDSQVTVRGSWHNPTLTLVGNMPVGKLGGHDIHDTNVKVSLLEKILYIDHITGQQGDKGMFQAAGSIDFVRGPIDIKLQADGLESGMFMKLAGFDVGTAGTTDIRAEVSGTYNDPAASMSIKITDGGIQGATFDDLTGSFRLQNGLVEVDSLVLRKTILQTNYQASARGTIPLKAIFAEKNDALDDHEQMKLTLALDDADLSLLPFVSPHIEWAQGNTDGTVQITGTPAHPIMNGDFVVKGGSVKIKEIYTPIEDIRLTLNFAGQSVQLAECSGRMGTGTYSLQGSTTLDGITPTDYAFDFMADHLDIQSDFYKGPLTANFKLSQKEMDWFNGRKLKLPLLAGQVTLENCTLSIPTVPESEGEAPLVLLDAGLNLGNKVRFYSPLVGNMTFTGSAHFGGSTRHPQPSGTISVARGGTINYMKTAVFKIEEGEAYFNQVGSFLPTVNFHAQTKLSHTKVFLDVTGPLGKDMKLSLTSTPEMSQTEILQLLTLRDAYEKGQQFTAGDALTLGLQMSVLSGLESQVRSFFDVDMFSISKGSGAMFKHDDTDKNDYNMQMGKYISDKVMLRYVQDFGESDLWRIGVQYDLNDRFSLTLDREGSKFIYGIEAKIKF